MKMLSIFAACLFASILAKADIVLEPGQSVYVSTPQNVSCVGSSSSAAIICDCDYDGVSNGQAVIFSGTTTVAACSEVAPDSTPMNCTQVGLSNGEGVICDCDYDGVSNGQAIVYPGSSSVSACSQVAPDSVPMNCH